MEQRIENTCSKNLTFSRGGLNVVHIRKHLKINTGTRKALVKLLCAQKKKKKATEKTMPVCKMSFYTQETLPSYIRTEISEKKCWNSMCRKMVPYNDYARKSIQVAQLIVVATIPKQKREAYIESKRNRTSRQPIPNDDCGDVVGFMFGFKSSYVYPYTGLHICQPHEWYIDIVCALKGWCGRNMIEFFFERARKSNKKQIRLYSLLDAIDTWKKYGFKECENSYPKRQQCRRKLYNGDVSFGVRMTYSLSMR